MTDFLYDLADFHGGTLARMSGATEIISRSFEERSHYTEIEELKRLHDDLLSRLDNEGRRDFELKLDMSWIHHDGALEGHVFSPQEIWTALSTQVRSDSAFQPSLNEVRAHKSAIDLIRSMTDKKQITIGPELIRRLYNTLASDDDQQTGALTYRKDIPIHRTYFHEIGHPSKIPAQMKSFFAWSKNPANRRLHPLHFGSSIHFRLMRIFPFTRHTGKVSRLVMNLVLIRAGYPPAVVHSTDRQNYYEAIRDGFDELFEVIRRALRDTLMSNIGILEGR
jgi:Fic family protein